MCGLFAAIGYDPNTACLKAVAHRGPDGEGWWRGRSGAGPVVLGHRRLAIIDTSHSADQPIVSPDGRLVLIYNGEIYNYVELREQLAPDWVFRTTSDSEVLLAAWARWGAECLDRLVGMFAFAIWDERDQTLTCVRDRFGVKPFYYRNHPAGLSFASEIKQLRHAPGHGAALNVERTFDFLSIGLTDHSEDTLFSSVRQLPPAGRVTFDLKRWKPGDPIQVDRWWTPRLDPDVARLGEAEAAEQFHALFMKSVEQHLRTDVPIGALLSGGLDSTSIVCAAAGSGGLGLKALSTFSAYFEEKEADERRFIDAAVAAADVRPTRIAPTERDLFARIDRVIRTQDEPFGSTSVLLQSAIFEAVGASGLKVVLDGQGADEQLAGYHGAMPLHLASLLRGGRWTEAGAHLLARRRDGVGFSAQLSPLASGLKARRGADGPGWLDGPASRDVAASGDAFQRASRAHGLPPPRDIGDLSRTMVAFSSLPMLLRYEDRNAMAHSVESRVPFLDHRLVEFTLSLGDRHKIVGGETKRVLRGAMKPYLPPEVYRRRDKLGFQAPESAWMRGPWRSAIQGMVEDALSRFPDFFAGDATRRMVGDILDGSAPHDFRPWRIACLGRWATLNDVAA